MKLKAFCHGNGMVSIQVFDTVEELNIFLSSILNPFYTYNSIGFPCPLGVYEDDDIAIMVVLEEDEK